MPRSSPQILPPRRRTRPRGPGGPFEERPPRIPLLHLLDIVSQFPRGQERDALTVCLYPDVHLVLGGMGNGVGAELDVRAGVHRLARAPHFQVQG